MTERMAADGQAGIPTEAAAPAVGQPDATPQSPACPGSWPGRPPAHRRQSEERLQKLLHPGPASTKPSCVLYLSSHHNAGNDTAAII